MHSAVVLQLPVGVVPVLVNRPSNPRSHKNGPLALKLSSKIHALQARSEHHQGFGAFSRPAYGSTKFLPNQQKCLDECPLSRVEFLLRAHQGRITSEMPVNCFGEVVDDAMVEEFGWAPTRENRARLAMRFINNDNKKGQADSYVTNLKDMYGNGASTLCLVYNATGDTLRYSASYDWWDSSLFRHGYPAEIGNGQWAAFLHVHSQGKPHGSFGAVVYRGKNRRGEDDRDFLLAWDTPWSLIETNKAYCQIGAVKFYEGCWDEIYNRMENSCYTSKSSADGVEIEAESERGTSPKFTAIIRA